MVKGIHHITAIGSDPKELVEFYSGVLGLRLVKKTVNQDDVSAYHLFFGDKAGEPGMDLTFFVFKGVGRGEVGAGQVSRISLAVRDSALDFWRERLEGREVRVEEVEMGSVRRLRFEDPDGLMLELVGIAEDEFDERVGEVWETDEVSREVAIGYFYEAELAVRDVDLMRPVLEGLGHKFEDGEGSGWRYELKDIGRAKYINLVEMGDSGYQGVGTVHHVAFGVQDEEELLSMREKILGMGLRPTGVIDRYYFKSVYFMTPAGILFELATIGPGFTADEPEDSLGEKLALPPFLEGRREEIERGLEGI